MSRYQTGDHESVGGYIDRAEVAIGKASSIDLECAVEWLVTYCGDSDDENIQAIANAIGFLEQEVAKREKAKRIAAAKRAYAAEHGVPYSQIRISK